MKTDTDSKTHGKPYLRQVASLTALAMSLAAASPAFSQSTQSPGAGATDSASDISTNSKAGDADASLAEVVVTGSSIRGVAPIGSNLVSVNRVQAEKIAAVNATELTNTLPAITQSGFSSLAAIC